MATPSLNHWFPSVALDVRITLPPAQNDAGPPALMVGVAGVGFTVTVTVELLTPPKLSVPVTV